MGANSSKQRYEYSYGENHPQDYNYNYANTQRARGMGMGQSYGQAPVMMPMGYPGTLNQPQQSQQPPQIIFPLLMHPMQQVSGPQAGQDQQNQQSQQQQQNQQYGQVQMQPMFGGQMPQNAMPTFPASQIPQPQMQYPGQMSQPDPQNPYPSTPAQMPQPETQSTTQHPPRSRYPLTPGPGAPMPELVAGQGPVMPEMRSPRPNANGIPRSFSRAPQISNSSSDSSSSSGSGNRMGRMANNPLPRPPRESEIPEHLLSGSAMAQTSLPPPPRSNSPLRNPLPPLPRDVYSLRKYRPLLVGSAYADHQKEVYPKDWFSEDQGRDHEGRLGRVFDRINPFRGHNGTEHTPGHRRHETMPELPRLPEFARESSTLSGSGSESSYASQGPRRSGLGRSFTSRLPFGRRRRGGNVNEEGQVMMMPTPMEEPQPPLMAEGPEPPPGFMSMPSPQVPGPEALPQPMQPLSPMPTPRRGILRTPRPQPAQPLSPGPPQSMPQPNYPLSPYPVPPLNAGQGPPSPNPNQNGNPQVFRFDSETPGYGGLSQLSPHRVLYRGKLYPTAAHLFEAHRFLGSHDNLARRVRKTGNLVELDGLLRSLADYNRPDWEEVLVDKMEEVLYLKLVQHEDLRNLLLDTGIADIVYAEDTDPFWGEGEHGEGANELGRALMRVRDRLRQEGGGR